MSSRCSGAGPGVWWMVAVDHHDLRKAELMTVTTGTSAPAETIGVYQAIGGRGALTPAVDDFYRRLLADPGLRPYFPGGASARPPGSPVTIPGEARGGPARDPGPRPPRAHRGP